MIEIRFSDLGWPVVSCAISKITGHWSNHVDFMLNDSTMISALPGGVRRWGKDSLSVKKEEVVSLRCSKDQERLAYEFILAQIGKPYDYSGIISFYFGSHWQDDKKWFCSELCASALIKAGVIPAIDTKRVSPSSLYKLLTELRG